MRYARISMTIPLLIGAILSVAGCGDRRDADVAAIKKTYAEFRLVLQQGDYKDASKFVSSDLLAPYTNRQDIFKDYFRRFTATDLAASMEMTSDAWVEFDRKNKYKAYLFPNRPPTVGTGFFKETNGWKITIEVLPIMD
jgi:hypothetical protein